MKSYLNYVKFYYQECWFLGSKVVVGWERRVIRTIALFLITKFCSPFDLRRLNSVTSFWCFSLCKFVLSGEMYTFLNCSWLWSLPDCIKIVLLISESTKRTNRGLAFGPIRLPNRVILLSCTSFKLNTVENSSCTLRWSVWVSHQDCKGSGSAFTISVSKFIENS